MNLVGTPDGDQLAALNQSPPPSPNWFVQVFVAPSADHAVAPRPSTLQSPKAPTITSSPTSRYQYARLNKPFGAKIAV